MQVILGWLQDVAEIDVAYENIMAEPTLQLQMLADALGVNAKVTSNALSLPFAPASSIWAARCHADRLHAACCTCMHSRTVQMYLEAPSTSCAIHHQLLVYTLPSCIQSYLQCMMHALSLCMRVSRMFCLICCIMQVDIAEVNRELQSLKPAQSGAPDPVSKLWPGHHSAAVQRQQEEGCTPLSDAEEKAETPNARLPSQNAQLKKQFPQFYAQYGYD